MLDYRILWLRKWWASNRILRDGRLSGCRAAAIGLDVGLIEIWRITSDLKIDRKLDWESHAKRRALAKTLLDSSFGFFRSFSLLAFFLSVSELRLSSVWFSLIQVLATHSRGLCCYYQLDLACSAIQRPCCDCRMPSAFRQSYIIKFNY